MEAKQGKVGVYKKGGGYEQRRAVHEAEGEIISSKAKDFQSSQATAVCNSSVETFLRETHVAVEEREGQNPTGDLH